MFEALKLEKSIESIKYILLNDDSNICYLISTKSSTNNQSVETDNINDYLNDKLGSEIDKYKILKVGPLKIDDEISLSGLILFRIFLKV